MIKAEVITNWSRKTNSNCKFLPFEKVKVSEVNKFESKKLQSKIGTTGTIVAVSTSSDGLMRGNGRQFTRYYVRFADGYIGGYHSHYLKRA